MKKIRRTHISSNGKSKRKCWYTYQVGMTWGNHSKKIIFSWSVRVRKKRIFHCRINTQTILKFPDKLIGRDAQLQQQYWAAANKQHSGLHRCTSPKLWGRQRCPMTARSTSRSRASCCSPCGLAPVVTVAAGTTWGHATPCYDSHHMMLVLLCV